MPPVGSLLCTSRERGPGSWGRGFRSSDSAPAVGARTPSPQPGPPCSANPRAAPCCPEAWRLGGRRAAPPAPVAANSARPVPPSQPWTPSRAPDPQGPGREWESVARPVSPGRAAPRTPQRAEVSARGSSRGAKGTRIHTWVRQGRGGSVEGEVGNGGQAKPFFFFK